MSRLVRRADQPPDFKSVSDRIGPFHLSEYERDFLLAWAADGYDVNKKRAAAAYAYRPRSGRRPIDTSPAALDGNARRLLTRPRVQAALRAAQQASDLTPADIEGATWEVGKPHSRASGGAKVRALDLLARMKGLVRSEPGVAVQINVADARAAIQIGNRLRALQTTEAPSPAADATRATEISAR